MHAHGTLIHVAGRLNISIKRSDDRLVNPVVSYSREKEKGGQLEGARIMARTLKIQEKARTKGAAGLSKAIHLAREGVKYTVHGHLAATKESVIREPALPRDAERGERGINWGEDTSRFLETYVPRHWARAGPNRETGSLGRSCGVCRFCLVDTENHGTSISVSSSAGKIRFVLSKLRDPRLLFLGNDHVRSFHQAPTAAQGVFVRQAGTIFLEIFFTILPLAIGLRGCWAAGKGLSKLAEEKNSNEDSIKIPDNSASDIGHASGHFALTFSVIVVRAGSGARKMKAHGRVPVKELKANDAKGVWKNVVPWLDAELELVGGSDSHSQTLPRGAVCSRFGWRSKSSPARSCRRWVLSMTSALSGNKKRWSLPSAGPRVRGTPSPRGPDRAVNILPLRLPKIALSRDAPSSGPSPDTLSEEGGSLPRLGSRTLGHSSTAWTTEPRTDRAPAPLSSRGDLDRRETLRLSGANDRRSKPSLSPEIRSRRDARCGGSRSFRRGLSSSSTEYPRKTLGVSRELQAYKVVEILSFRSSSSATGTGATRRRIGLTGKILQIRSARNYFGNTAGRGSSLDDRTARTAFVRLQIPANDSCMDELGPRYAPSVRRIGGRCVCGGNPRAPLSALVTPPAATVTPRREKESG
ncbi:hypothetical protein KM043_000748 [Ampulex compressa]|nr:hypothetical protein KM043_000748 [Ampulex compressa]